MLFCGMASRVSRMKKGKGQRCSELVLFAVLAFLTAEVCIYYFFPLAGISYVGLADLGPGKIFQDFVFLFDYGKDCTTTLGDIYINSECSITPYNLPLWIIWLIRAVRFSSAEGRAVGAALDLSFLYCIYLVYKKIIDVQEDVSHGYRDSWWGFLMAALIAGYPVRLALERANLDLFVFVSITISCFAAAYVLKRDRFSVKFQRLLGFKESNASDQWLLAILIASLPIGLSSALKLYSFLALFVMSVLSSSIVISSFSKRALSTESQYDETWPEKRQDAFSLRTSLCLLCLQWTFFTVCFGVVQSDLEQIRMRIPTTNSGGDLFTGLTSDIASSFTSGAIETITVKILLIAVSFTLFLAASRQWLQSSTKKAYSQLLDGNRLSDNLTIPLLAVLFGFTISVNYLLSTPIVYRFIFSIPVIMIGCIQLESYKNEVSHKKPVSRCILLIQLSSLVTFWYGYRPYYTNVVFIAESFIYTICHPLLIGFSIGIMLQNARYLKRYFYLSLRP